MDGCPANAYTKDDRWGAVLLNADRCIGCRYCSWVCPYDAPQFQAATGLMQKCTFCSHRLDAGGSPACVVACPVGALGFVGRGEPGPLDHPGLPETGLVPGLSVVPKRGAATPPEMTAGSRSGTHAATVASRRDGLSSEWTLFVFSYLLSLLVAWFAASRSGRVPFHLPVFLVAGAFAMGISLLHLGRPARAWRAVSNFRRSWVSREVFFSTSFLIAVPISVGWSSTAGGVDGLVVALGFCALGSMDMVYRVRGQPFPVFPHSAMTLLTAVLLTGLLLQDPWLAGPAWALKLTLFLSRTAGDPGLPWPIPAIRILTGFVWPVVVGFALTEPSPATMVAGVLIGEALDRALFYAELRFPGPALQAELDLRAIQAAA
jgi:DMSO reductase anchor subunit/ferredoxin